MSFTYELSYKEREALADALKLCGFSDPSQPRAWAVQHGCWPKQPQNNFIAGLIQANQRNNQRKDKNAKRK